MRTRVAALALALGVLGGCSSPAADTQVLEALEETAAAPFGFTVRVQADATALAGLGPQAAGAAELLAGASVEGVVDGASTVLELRALGGSLLELRQVAAPDGPVLYVRAGIVDLLAEVGVEDLEAERQVRSGLAARGATPEVLAAVEQAFDGGWIAVPGGFGEVVASGEATTGRNVLDDGLTGLVEQFAVVADLGGEVFRVGLDVAALLEAAAGGIVRGPAFDPERLREGLGELDGVVAVDVALAEGRVVEAAVDLAQGLRAFGNDATGQVVLRLELVHDADRLTVAAPPDALPVSRAVLDEAIALLFDLG